MSEIKSIQFLFPEHFLNKIDDYVEKVNDSKIYPMKYKRSILATEAIEYFIDNDLALKQVESSSK